MKRVPRVSFTKTSGCSKRVFFSTPDKFETACGVSFRDLSFKEGPGLFWDDFGMTLGSLWDDFGVTLGSLWDDFGITLGSLWDDFG